MKTENTAQYCTIPECGRPFLARGWCKLHWQHWYRTGDPLKGREKKNTNPCKHEECPRNETRSSGYCNVHLKRLQRTGTSAGKYPEGKWDNRKLPVEERFWLLVDKGGPIPDYAPDLGRCWLWKGRVSSQGYGQFFVGRKSISPQAFAFGGQPEGLELDHLCAVPNCVNPYHLEAITGTENLKRSWEHRRWLKQR
jgi:hypothetical protein